MARDFQPIHSRHHEIQHDGVRAEALYHKLQLGELRHKDPPILNPTRRPVTFIYTTWDRFSQAKVLSDLYSEADGFVDRIFHALERSGVHSERIWEADAASNGGAQLRVLCEDGTVIASTAPADERVIPLPIPGTAESVRASVEVILEAIRKHGGPLMIGVPIEE